MKASSLVIVGAGGHGKVVADAAINAGYTVAGFIDDRLVPGTVVIGVQVLGSIAWLENRLNEYDEIFVAVGDGIRRMEIIEYFLSRGANVAIIVDPSASVSRFAALGTGTVVLAQGAINAGANLGRGVIVNTGATVDHDCVLGDGVHICPGVHLSGNVVVGKTTWIGVGSSVRQSINIGANVMVGAGSVVVSDISDGQVVAGVPAKVRAPA